jgi:hypothetical protein
MLCVFGICERCKEAIELKLNYVALEKNADVDVHFSLCHKPQPINKTVCGGRVRIVSVSEINSEDIRTILPIELWQALYEEGMTYESIADVFKTTLSKVWYELIQKNKRHNITVVKSRRQGTRAKN